MDRRDTVVLVAVDLATHRADPVLTALELVGESPGSTIHLLSVLDPAQLSDTDSKSLLAQEEEYLAATPARLQEHARTVTMSHARQDSRAKIVGHARIGAVVETILQACVDYDADFLICGTRARRGFAHARQGAVAGALVRGARCPVIVARPKNYHEVARTPLPDPPLRPDQRPVHAVAPRSEGHISSTTLDSWEPSDNGPTGFRIV